MIHSLPDKNVAGFNHIHIIRLWLNKDLSRIINTNIMDFTNIYVARSLHDHIIWLMYKNTWRTKHRHIKTRSRENVHKNIASFLIPILSLWNDCFFFTQLQALQQFLNKRTINLKLANIIHDNFTRIREVSVRIADQNLQSIIQPQNFFFHRLVFTFISQSTQIKKRLANFPKRRFTLVKKRTRNTFSHFNRIKSIVKISRQL